MLNLFRMVILFTVLFCGTKLFAQQIDAQKCNLELQQVDADQDAFIVPSEMQAYQARTFNNLDKDKNGVIDLIELEADQSGMHKLADKDQDGKITQDESVSQFNEYFKQMDKNQDGKVSEAEYTDYWKLIYKF
ncbi:MAG: hypothetical protein PHS66_07480 [Candidatus Omnitrophica bacterium]|nr:hypothetical protein [Candidatus Omnitrophota bacterium]